MMAAWQPLPAGFGLDGLASRNHGLYHSHIFQLCGTFASIRISRTGHTHGRLAAADSNGIRRVSGAHAGAKAGSPYFQHRAGHPRLLPKYRGRSVAEWAIFEDAPVGLTVHLVDPGVDTGAFLQQQTVDGSDCATIAEMRQKLRYLQHRLLADCAREFLRGHLEPQPQRKEAGKQYYEMHPALKAVVEAKLARGCQPAITGAITLQPVPTPC